MRNVSILLALVSLFFAGCNTTPVKPDPLISLTSAQIKEIQNYDELIAMRSALAVGLDGKAEVDYADDYVALAQIDSQIVEMKKSEISTQFAASRLDSGVVPLPSLLSIASGVEQAPIPQEKWQAVGTYLQVEKDKTAAYAGTLQDKVEAMTDPAQALPLYDELAEVTGDSMWQTKRDDTVSAMIEDVRQAKLAEEFSEETRKKIELIKSFAPEDDNLRDEMISVDAKIYEKTFFAQLSENRPDDAYLTLVQMSEAQDFELLKGKLAPISEKMATYFTALADDSVKKKENLAQSYRWYEQALKVRSILDLPEANKASFSALTDQLHTNYKKLKKNEEHSAALAHLYAIRSFQPNRSGIRKELVEQELVVTNLAVKRLSTTDFQSSYKDQDYGDVISSFVTQYLFEHVPHDVRIVEREQYEAILRERKLSGNTDALSSVNLLVSGSVLESKVDSTEAKNKKMMRVEVGKETIPNPNYISWLELGSRDRKGIDKPSETIDVVKHENISVGVTHHRKVGIFSVSYRLVAASTGRVIFPDSITLSTEHSDESSEGVEMGDFVVPFKVADLPSDVEILDGLAKKVSTEIGKKLVGELRDQELKYIASAARYAEQNDCASQVSELGSALMIMRQKSLETADLASEFESQAVNCFN